MNLNTATREDLETLTTEQLGESFSDAFKDVNGWRPRWEPSREELIRFWLSYDENLRESIERDREEELAYQEHRAEQRALKAEKRRESDELAAVGSIASKAYNMGVPWDMMQGWEA